MRVRQDNNKERDERRINKLKIKVACTLLKENIPHPVGTDLWQIGISWLFHKKEALLSCTRSNSHAPPLLRNSITSSNLTKKLDHLWWLSQMNWNIGPKCSTAASTSNSVASRRIENGYPQNLLKLTGLSNAAREISIILISKEDPSHPLKEPHRYAWNGFFWKTASLLLILRLHQSSLRNIGAFKSRDWIRRRRPMSAIKYVADSYGDRNTVYRSGSTFKSRRLLYLVWQELQDIYIQKSAWLFISDHFERPDAYSDSWKAVCCRCHKSRWNAGTWWCLSARGAFLLAIPLVFLHTLQ